MASFSQECQGLLLGPRQRQDYYWKALRTWLQGRHELVAGDSAELPDQAVGRPSLAGLAELPPRRVVNQLAQRLDLGAGPGQVLHLGLVRQVLEGDHALKGLPTQIDPLSFELWSDFHDWNIFLTFNTNQWNLTFQQQLSRPWPSPNKEPSRKLLAFQFSFCATKSIKVKNRTLYENFAWNISNFNFPFFVQ